MKNDEKLWEICEDIYRELYKEATPSADFDELKEGKLHKDSDVEKGFKDHYLPQDRQEEILEKHVEKHDLTEHEREKVSVEVMLDAAPVGNKKAWREQE